MMETFNQPDFLGEAAPGTLMNVTIAPVTIHQRRQHIHSRNHSQEAASNVRERTREALEMLNGVKLRRKSSIVEDTETSNIIESRYTASADYTTGYVQNRVDISDSSNPAIKAVRKTKSPKSIKPLASASYSLFPSPSSPKHSSPNRARSRTLSEDLPPPLPALTSPHFSSAQKNAESFSNWRQPTKIDLRTESTKPSASKKAEPIPNLESQRPKTSTGAESSPAPIGTKPTAEHRKLSLSDIRRRSVHWAPQPAQRSRSTTIRTENNVSFNTQEGLSRDDETAEKKKKSSSWELPSVFRRRNTLEKGKHRSTPALRSIQNNYEPFPDSLYDDADEGLSSPFRSEFSDESGDEGEVNDEQGKFTKLMKRMRRKMKTKKSGRA